MRDRQIDRPGSIKPAATNLTIGTSIVAFLAMVGSVWNDTFKSVFGDNVANGTRAAVIIAIIAAWAIVAAADLLARAWTTAASERAAHGAITPPSGLHAHLVEDGAVDTTHLYDVQQFLVDAQKHETFVELSGGGDGPRLVDASRVRFVP